MYTRPHLHHAKFHLNPQFLPALITNFALTIKHDFAIFYVCKDPHSARERARRSLERPNTGCRSLGRALERNSQRALARQPARAALASGNTMFLPCFYQVLIKCPKKYRGKIFSETKTNIFSKFRYIQMVFIDINGVLIKKEFFWCCDKRWDSKLYAKKQKTNKKWRRPPSALASATSSARSLVGEVVLAARSALASGDERNVDP